MRPVPLIVAALLAALACALPAVAATAADPASAPPEAAPAQASTPPAKKPAKKPVKKPAEEPPPYWVLEEFDWGDTKSVVEESLLFDPHFKCKGTRSARCALVTTVIEKELLLARFDFHQGELWQVGVLTPDLDTKAARKHIRRVWRLLTDYVARLRGEPELAVDLPPLEGLALGPPQVTHFWARPGLEVRVMVGRRDTDLFYVGVWLSDPKRGPAARDPYLAELTKSDEHLRAARARRAAREAEGKQEP